MWIIVGIDGAGRATELKSVAQQGEVPSLAWIQEAARAFGGDTVLTRHVDREVELVREYRNSVSLLDGIQRWSERARKEDGEANDGRPVSTLKEGELAILDEPGDDESRIAAAAWHDRATAIVQVPDGIETIEIQYQPEPRDQSLFEYHGLRSELQNLTIETICDARGYYGDHSAVVDHWRVMRSSGAGFATSLKSSAGFLVFRTLRLFQGERRVPDDPTFRSRQRHMLGLFPGVASDYPDLGAASTKHTHDDAIVFVHGTVSCGLQALKDLSGSPFPMYRFEHDTFHSISENASQLAYAVTRYLEVKRLVLVGHSRGGLVARLAMSRLSAEKFAADMSLLTFGTPHTGTPVVDAVAGIISLLIRAGGLVIDGIPLLSPAVAALSYLHGATEMPPGIEVMRDGSESLKLINLAQAPASVRCWGSAFDINHGPSGFGVSAEGALSGAMAGVQHDLVVPLASALAFGQPQPNLSCSHIRYFEEAGVKNAIFTALPPRPPVPPPQVSRPVGQVVEEDEWVTIGGIRVPKRKS